jgi:hypothetical protein
LFEKRPQKNVQPRVSRFIKLFGYAVLFGVFIGIAAGAYALFNPPFFSILTNIGQYEATLFFLGVYLPSFIIIVAIGYIFVTTPILEKLNFRFVAILCAEILLCLTLSALSIFNLLSFLGTFSILAIIIFAYTKPSFKALWKREASFLVQTGSILITSASGLFLIMWLISGFLQTYSPGINDANYAYPFVLLIILALSAVTFLVTPSLSLHGANVGFAGILNLAVGISSLSVFVQARYDYFNFSAYTGIFMAGIGTFLTFCGALIYVRLFLSDLLFSTAFEPSFVYRGKYCPYCGATWKDFDKNSCSSCERNLNLKLRMTFCPHCGLIVPKSTNYCPHCKEDIGSLPVSILLRRPVKGESLLGKWKPKKLEKAIGFANSALNRLDMRLEEFIYICILTFTFAFLSFIGYVRTEPGFEGGWNVIVYYGFPLQWLQVFSHLFTRSNTLRVGAVTITFSALIVDLVLFFLMAFAIVYGIRKLRVRITS